MNPNPPRLPSWTLALFALFALVLTALSFPVHADTPTPTPRFAHTAAGGWTVSTSLYVATVSPQGYLTSLKVGATEAVGRPFTLDPDGGLAATDVTRDGDTLLAKMTGKNGSTTIAYTFRPDGFTIDPKFGGPFGRYYFQASPALQGIELLNDKRAGAEDALEFVDAGEVRGVPAVRSSRNQRVRFHFPGFALTAYCQRWGAPYNYEGTGSLIGYDWDAEQLDGSMPLIFTVARDRSAYTLPALAFAPRATRVAGVYDTPDTSWVLDFGRPEDHAALTAAGVHALALHWQLTDIHDQPAGEGTATVNLTAPAAPQSVTVRTPGSGYYQVLFRLAEASGKMRPSSFQTRFTVVHPTPGLAALPAGDGGTGLSAYRVVSMIGAGANRESHVVSEFFTDAPQTGPDWQKVDAPGHPVWMNVKALDGLFHFASSEGQATGVTWFYQSNGRPAYAVPPVYEAMAFALVSRYKSFCHVWEVENEPNFSYPPASYVANCLVPFAAGAHRADPTCTVIGPDCVDVPATLQFAQAIYDAGANKSLDALSTHSYPGPGESWEQFGNLSTLAALRSLMAAHGDAAKPLWQTEQGYGWDLSPRDRVARYVVRQFLQGWRAGGILPSHQYYFYPQYGGFISMYETGGGEAGNENSWLPHAAALRFFAENTVGRHYAGNVPSPYKGVYLARFNGDGDNDDVVAAWTFDFPLTLNVSAQGYRSAVGFMGNPAPVPPPTAVDNYALPLSGEPIYVHVAKGSAFTVVSPAFGRNLALASAGGIATASSEAPGHPASFANDDNWELWAAAGALPGRTAWQSAHADPSVADPDTLTVTFPIPRTLTRILALCYLPAVSATPRDWDFQADVKGKWVTVGAAKADTGWALSRTFAPVTASGIRMRITAINDGWFHDRRTMFINRGPKPKTYTDARVLVSELEAYGPPTPVTLSAQAPDAPQAALFPSVPITLGLANDARPLDGTLTVSVPPGWTATPASVPVHLTGPEQPTLPPIQVSPPPDVPTGATPVRVTLTDSAGKTLDAAGTTINVTPPVEATPQTPAAITPAAQPLVVSLHNVTARPLSGTVMAQAGPRQAAPIPFGPLAPNGTQTVALTVPNLTLSDRPTTVTYTVNAEHLVTTASQSLSWRGWSVVGPFPNDNGAGFDAVYPPEKAIDLDAALAGAGGQTVHWQPALSDADGFVNLLSLFQPNQNVVAYAVIAVKSAVARTALLSAGSDDGLKAWVNGKLILSDNAVRGAAPGEDEAPVALHAGWNHVLLKITQGGGGWGFYCDLLDSQHRPLPGLIYRARAQ